MCRRRQARRSQSLGRGADLPPAIWMAMACVDIVISNNNDTPSVLRNATASAGKWIGVRLEGSGSNRDGYGSEVIVTTDLGRRMRAYADTSGSYLSASSPVLHFGLGAEGEAREIEVVWPSGRRTVWKGAAANRVLNVD